MPAEKAKASDMYVAAESFVDGDGNSYHKDITRVSGKLVAKKKWEHLFKALEVSHPDIEKATAAPGEKRGEKAEPDDKSKPEGLTTSSVKIK
jgi:hypothetical protein